MDVAICRGCRKPIIKGEKVSEVSAYWTPFAKYPVHKACKSEALRTEAIECQIIDADCNDCKHFQRGEMLQKRIYQGHCLKFDKPTKAYVNLFSGHECFEHRRL